MICKDIDVMTTWVYSEITSFATLYSFYPQTEFGIHQLDPNRLMLETNPESI